MSSYKVTKKAHADLIEIGRFTAKKWGISQRDSYLKQLDKCFSHLSGNPQLGIACDYIVKGYRKFSQGSHLIFYKQGPGGTVEIIRILYKSMDVESKL